MTDNLDDVARDKRWILIVICVTFFSVGMSQAAIGPMLPHLARRLETDIATTGSVFTTLYAGALIGQICSALLYRRLGYWAVLFGGMLLALVGAIGFSVSSNLLQLLCSGGILGLANGFLLLSGNVLATEAAENAGPVNFVNALFGVGAIVSPTLVAIAMAYTGEGITAFWVVPISTLVTLVLLILRVGRPDTKDTESADEVIFSNRSLDFLLTPLIWVICAFGVSYISMEVGMSTWLPTLLHRAAEISLVQSAMAASLLWFLITLSRFVAALASRKFTPIVILFVSSALCILGGGFLVLGSMTGEKITSLLASALLGIGFGPILPTLLTIIQHYYRSKTAVATGLVFGVGNIGGALFPLAMGTVIVNAGVVAASALILGSGFLMLLFLFLFTFLMNRS